MSKDRERARFTRRLTAWVDGEREPKDQTLFVMEQHPPRHVRQSEEEFQRREEDRLRKFFNWYPIAAAVICAVLVGKVMKPLQKCLEPFLGRVCFEKRRETCERTKNVPGSDAGNDQSSGDSFRRNADAVDG